MAANDTFPRGWVTSTFVNSLIIPSLSMPPAVGVAHVLTHVNVAYYYLSNVAGLATPRFFTSVVQDVTGVRLALPGPLVDNTVAVAGGYNVAQASITWDGKLSSQPGLALQLTVSTPLLTGENMYLEMQGYDV